MALQTPYLDTLLGTDALDMRPDYLQALVRAIPFGMCGVDTNGQVLFLNPAGEKLIGRREDDCHGQSFHQLTQCHIEVDAAGQEVDACSQVGCPVSYVLQTGRSVRSTLTFFQVSGERRQPVECECIPLLEEQDSGVLISFRDVSRQLELERDRQRLISIPEESPGPIVEFDRHANMVYANPAMRDLLVQVGFSKTAFPTILPANLMALIQECLQTHLPVQGVEVDNGCWCYAWSFSPLPEMQLVRAYGVDLTERKRAADAVHESEMRYRELFENASDGIATFALDGTVLTVNRGLELMLGRSREELCGTHYRTWLTPEAAREAEADHQRILTGEKLPSIFEVEWVCQDGSVLTTEGRTRFIRDSSGRQTSFQGIYRDVTERKKAERELRRAKEAAEEAARAKSEFLSTMSHELRTPLAVILGYCDLLEDDEGRNLDAEQQTGLQRIRKSATDLLDLITALLDLNRLEAGQLPVDCQEVEIAALILELQAETQGLQDQSSLSFVWTVDSNLPHLQTDLRKLKVIVKNLIGNAVKFTQNGSVSVVVRSQQGGIEISVVDTGIGIPADELARIFEPFQQVDNSANGLLKGSGLGLNIVKRFVTLLGGTVTVESEVGHGTTFRIWLPCHGKTSQGS
jgi:PAS domain S-box-containing protein